MIFDEAIKIVLAHEGGWCDVSGDAGGETQMGLSMAWILKTGLTPKDLGLNLETFTPGCLKQVTKDTAISLYRKYFWEPSGYSNIKDQNTAIKLFDLSVNAGAKRANKLAQQAANSCGQTLLVDGSLGPKSFAAINSIDPQTYINAYGAQMEAFYRGIVAANPTQAKFLNGWLKRAKWGCTQS